MVTLQEILKKKKPASAPIPTPTGGFTPATPEDLQASTEQPQISQATPEDLAAGKVTLLTPEDLAAAQERLASRREQQRVINDQIAVAKAGGGFGIQQGRSAVTILPNKKAVDDFIRRDARAPTTGPGGDLVRQNLQVFITGTVPQRNELRARAVALNVAAKKQEQQAIKQEAIKFKQEQAALQSQGGFTPAPKETLQTFTPRETQGQKIIRQLSEAKARQPVRTAIVGGVLVPLIEARAFEKEQAALQSQGGFTPANFGGSTFIPAQTPKLTVLSTISKVASGKEKLTLDLARGAISGSLLKQEEKQRQLELKVIKEQGSLKGQVAGFKTISTGAITGFLGTFAAVLSPKKTARSLVKVAKDPVGAGSTLASSFVRSPGGFIGEVVGSAGGSKLIFKAGSIVSRTARTQTTLAGTKVRPAEEVFDPKVLRGKETFSVLRAPKSGADIAREFTSRRTPEGTIPVTSATAVKFESRTAVGKGSSETPGLFVTPIGRTNVRYLRLVEQQSSDLSSFSAGIGKDFSLFPKKQKPGIILLENVQDVKRLPLDVRESFGAAAKFVTERPGSTTAFVPPKAEIRAKAKAKTEIEAVITPGTIIEKVPAKTITGKVKGFEEATVVQQQGIPVFKFRIVKQQPRSVLGKPGVKKLTPEQIAKSEKSFKEFEKFSKKTSSSSFVERPTPIISPSRITKLSSRIRSIPSSSSKIIPVSSRPTLSAIEPSSIVSSSIGTSRAPPSRAPPSRAPPSRAPPSRAPPSGIAPSKVLISRSAVGLVPRSNTVPPIRKSGTPFVPRKALRPKLRELDVIKSKKIIRKPKKQPKAFTPTAFAAGFGIRAKKREAKGLTVTGLSLRALSPEPKKRRRKKKIKSTSILRGFA